MKYFLIFLVCVSTALATTYNSNGSQSDTQSKINGATTGDTVTVAAGTFTWGAGGSQILINNAITLRGINPTGTTILIASDAGANGAGPIQISAAATVRDLAVVQSSGSACPFVCSTSNGWRITNITYVSTSSSEVKFALCSSYGLIDSNDITGNNSPSELILCYGPSNSWQTPDNFGGTGAVYVETNTFRNLGYVCDGNANSRMVVRFNTITGPMKIDSHGLASNTPARGARWLLAYNNHWTGSGGFWAAMDFRSGTFIAFDNVCDSGPDNPAPGQVPIITLEEYGCYQQWPNFGNVYQTPTNYPIADQIGVGQDPKAAASAPAYLFNNTIGGVSWQVNYGWADFNIAAGAQSLYTSQGGTGPFSISANAPWIAARDRDYFIQAASGTFTGASGVGRGTKGAMLALSPSKVGVGYWVTDESSWRTGFPGTSGQLYQWNGSAWVIWYTPYAYPFVAASGGTPTLSSASIPSAGTSLSAVFSESCTTGVGGNGGMTISATGGAVTLSYLTGSGTATYTFTTSRPINAGETVVISYAQPGGGIEATIGGIDLASFASQPVGNNSTQGGGGGASNRISNPSKLRTGPAFGGF